MGNIEQTEDELQYLANLIFSEVRKYSFGPSVSLSLAVFLVWMGILYYQDGNFWVPVFEVLKVPAHRQSSVRGDEAKGLELDRDLKVALSEYAPESQVVAGGKLWTSMYIKKLPDRNPIKYSYAICDYCGYYRSSIAEKRR